MPLPALYDVLSVRSEEVTVHVRKGAVEGVERSESQGVGVRVFEGKRSAILSSSETGEEVVKNMAEQALAIAREAPEDPFSGLAPEERLAGMNLPDPDLEDPSGEPDVSTLTDLALEAETAALETPGITNSEGAEFGFRASEMTYRTSHGFERTLRSTSLYGSVCVLASGETGMERDYAYRTVRHRADFPNAATIGREAAQRTLKRLNPRKAATGAVPVFFDPRTGRQLLGSFLSAISGASVARGTSFLKEAMGTSLFAPHITITDDPLRKRGLASRPFDGEGIGCSPLTLVENGVLQHWLLDCRSARQLKLETNGRASRGLASPPSPASTNAWIHAGTQTPDALMREAGNGIYVTDLFGMGVNLVTGDYSQGAAGFYVENGEIAYPVSEITIAGNLRDMFAGLTPANDLAFDYAVNTPTLRIGRMMVAGA